MQPLQVVHARRETPATAALEAQNVRLQQTEQRCCNSDKHLTKTILKRIPAF